MASRHSHAPTDSQVLAASSHGQADKVICGCALAMGGGVATARRHSLLGLHWLTDFFLLITDLSDNSDFFFLNGAASVKSVYR